MDPSLSVHRRPLPASSIAFSSEQGRELFREALEAGHLEAFFPLIEQFHTQSDPAFCGLGSLVMALNALGIDPGRVWRGPWRWFSEELLDCCTPLSKVQLGGVTLDEVACLARCNGAEVALGHGQGHSLEAFRGCVEAASRGKDQVLIASYSRRALEQTGDGHFSPIGGYHAGRDMLLLLDVARFKYPPHWVPLERLFEAMQDVDPVTGRPRGWVALKKRASASAVARFLVCEDGLGVRVHIERLLALQVGVSAEATSLEGLLRGSGEAVAASGIAERVRLRVPEAADQQQLYAQTRALLESAPLFERAARVLGPEAAARVLVWWLAAPDTAWQPLPPGLRAELSALLEPSVLLAPLADEVRLLRSQIEFLLAPQACRTSGSAAQ